MKMVDVEKRSKAYGTPRTPIIFANIFFQLKKVFIQSAHPYAANLLIIFDYYYFETLFLHIYQTNVTP